MNVTALILDAEQDKSGLRPLFSSFLWAYLLTAGSLVLFGSWWGEAGYDMLLVAMGWPHVFLGFIFYFNKVIKGQVPHRTYFWILISLTLLICLVHTFTPVTTLIYVYFVFHALRDEIFIYHQRRTGFQVGGPIFKGVGLSFLAVVVLLSGLEQFSWQEVIRSLEIPSRELASGEYLIRFDPVENSRGRELYFSLTAPGTEGVTSIRSFGSRQDVEPTGELLISGKPWSLRDLHFRPYYAAQAAPAASPAHAPRASSPLLVTGGHSVGQSFRAEAGHLSAIAVPLEVDPPLAPDFNLQFKLKSAFQVNHPFFEEGSLFLLLFLGGMLSALGRPCRLFQQYPELRYFVPLLVLFVGMKFLLELGRYYALLTPLFFFFLVVFHYFSWYIFSLEIIEQRSSSPHPVRIQDPNLLDRFLQKLDSRQGFLSVVVILNLVSLTGVMVWYALPEVTWLKYAFDLEYFLYFLVFHVTMSFAPKKKPAPAPAS